MICETPTAEIIFPRATDRRAEICGVNFRRRGDDFNKKTNGEKSEPRDLTPYEINLWTKTKRIWKKKILVVERLARLFSFSMVFSAVHLSPFLGWLDDEAKDSALPLATFFCFDRFFSWSFRSFIRWVFCWAQFKRFLFGCACFRNFDCAVLRGGRLARQT